MKVYVLFDDKEVVNIYASRKDADDDALLGIKRTVQAYEVIPSETEKCKGAGRIFTRVLQDGQVAVCHAVNRSEPAGTGRRRTADDRWSPLR